MLGASDSSATPPRSPSYPKRALILTLSLFIGYLCGAGIGALREYRDRSLRVASQVRDDLGLEFLGMLPVVERQLPSRSAAASGGIKGRSIRTNPCSAIRSITPYRAFPRHCALSRSRQI